jgi:hypothetical protein
MGKIDKLNEKICFIAGAGHSGSTLLGLILGSNLECFYAGEANKIKFLGTSLGDEENRFCKICGKNCPIWTNLKFSDETNIYEYLSAKTNKPLIIDSTKKTSWIEQRIDQMSKTSSKIFLIYLIRDGRAVVNSRIRKYPNMEASQLIKDWIEQIKATNNLFEHFTGDKIKIHYERLAEEPEKIVKKLSNFLGISYNENMLRYYEFEHHPLGGNSGTQSLIAKAQKDSIKNAYVKLSDRNQYYYENHPLEIKLDLRWKNEMSKDTLDLFQNMAGELNYEFMW